MRITEQRVIIQNISFISYLQYHQHVIHQSGARCVNNRTADFSVSLVVRYSYDFHTVA